MTAQRADHSPTTEELVDGPYYVAGKPHIRPSDAATLVMYHLEEKTPRILMGRRSAAHTFLPGKYAFPGGGLDLADMRVKPADKQPGAERRKLMARMRGRKTPARARGLALAAVRETFEETGIIIGKRVKSPPRSRHAEWQSLFDTGHAPSISGLRLLARAITPPGRPRRYDARFFALDATGLDLHKRPPEDSTDELSEVAWLSFEDCRAQDHPYITGQILDQLEQRLTLDEPWAAARKVPFYHMRNRRFLREWL